MKAEELRLNNLIKIGGNTLDTYQTFTPEKVTLAILNEIKGENIERPDAMLSVFNPIPLTEEWLLKFGFELLPWGWVHNTLKDKAVLVRWNNKDKYWIELGNGLRIELPYVHTLQNFFALTGTELQLKER